MYATPEVQPNPLTLQALALTWQSFAEAHRSFAVMQHNHMQGEIDRVLSAVRASATSVASAQHCDWCYQFIVPSEDGLESKTYFTSFAYDGTT